MVVLKPNTVERSRGIWPYSSWLLTTFYLGTFVYRHLFLFRTHLTLRNALSTRQR